MRKPMTVLMLACLPIPAGAFEILAHRGVHQPIRRDAKIDRDTCTAPLIAPSDHDLIENTIPSILAAFQHGATVVEIDVHGTADGEVVVFHDWTLECRTDGQGVTERQELTYLRGLDVGHGYTRDGQTFPWRGRGLRMPTLREVLDAFPDRLLLNMKSGSVRVLDQIVSVLEDYPDADLAFYCDKAEINRALKERLPRIHVPRLTKAGVRRCLAGFGSSGELPDGCEDAEMMLPNDAFRRMGVRARYLLRALDAVGSRLYVWGVDDEAAARYVRQFPVAGIVTDRVELTGPTLSAPRSPG